MTRVEGVDPDRTDKRIRTVLEAQAEKWGAPLLNHLIYARCPTFSTVPGRCGVVFTPRASWSRRGRDTWVLAR